MTVEHRQHRTADAVCSDVDRDLPALDAGRCSQCSPVAVLLRGRLQLCKRALRRLERHDATRVAICPQLATVLPGVRTHVNNKVYSLGSEQSAATMGRIVIIGMSADIPSCALEIVSEGRSNAAADVHRAGVTHRSSRGRLHRQRLETVMAEAWQTQHRHTQAFLPRATSGKMDARTSPTSAPIQKAE